MDTLTAALLGSLAVLLGCASTAPQDSGPANPEVPPRSEATPEAADRAPMRPRVELGFGHRVLVEDAAWSGADGLSGFGLQLVHPLGPAAPLAIEGGLTRVTDDTDLATQVDLRVTEAFIGLRFAIPPDEGVTTPRLEPYVAGGLSFLHAELESGPVEDDADAIGAYVRVGLACHLSRRVVLSFDYRVHHETDIDIAAGPLTVSDSSLDGAQFSVWLGLAF
ncbi:outer membrane beta-barrel protein [Engelhardtia mirabilis]|uniref:Outer membrane protein beta-barrel domain-containing protein n=1 Tax=Engelhardtia mirabilis TaxID=2528011 RepID=A0A518BFL0_9BACT|nr:hypothetical protein Pla133_08360 [Planctomycetes bacterium Pla133]QDV00096.1 hypothetical protein Pla86_08350 [Planctomycetes bacterium Pla86]